MKLIKSIVIFILLISFTDAALTGDVRVVGSDGSQATSTSLEGHYFITQVLYGSFVNVTPTDDDDDDDDDAVGGGGGFIPRPDDCEDGEITEFCMCNGEYYSSGWCINDRYYDENPNRIEVIVETLKEEVDEIKERLGIDDLVLFKADDTEAGKIRSTLAVNSVMIFVIVIVLGYFFFFGFRRRKRKKKILA